MAQQLDAEKKHRTQHTYKTKESGNRKLRKNEAQHLDITTQNSNSAFQSQNSDPAKYKTKLKQNPATTQRVNSELEETKYENTNSNPFLVINRTASKTRTRKSNYTNRDQKRSIRKQ